MATAYPNSRYAQRLPLPLRALREVTAKAARVSSSNPLQILAAPGCTGSWLLCTATHFGIEKASSALCKVTAIGKSHCVFWNGTMEPPVGVHDSRPDRS